MKNYTSEYQGSWFSRRHYAVAGKSGIRISDNKILGLIGRIYDAAADPSVWEDVLVDIGKPVKSDSAQLVSVSSDPAFSFDDLYIGIDQQKAIREFEELVRLKKHVRVNYVGSVPEMTTVFDYMHTSEREMKRDVCYQEHLIPSRVPYYVATPLIATTDSMTAVGHFRRKRYGHFRKSEIEFLARFAPHMRRSLELSRRLPRQGMIAGMDALLSALNCAAAVVDQELSVLASNDGFSAILSHHDGISTVDGKVRVPNRAAQYRLYREVTASVTAERANEVAGSGLVAVQRESGRKSYQVFVTPLESRVSLSKRRMCLLLAVDTDQAPAVSTDLIRDILGLTRSEAEVAGLLASGHNLREIARIRRTGIETTRSQVKAALRKTECRRQAELVSRICRLSGMSVNV